MYALLAALYMTLGLLFVGGDAWVEGREGNGRAALASPPPAPPRPPRPGPVLAALSLAACTSILGLSAYLFSTGAPPGAEAATLWVAGGGAWWALDRTRLGLALAALTAAAAPTSELVLMQVVGLWHYAAPDWFPLGPSVPGLPSWVPACYFAYATWVGCVARALAAWGRCDG